MSLHDISSSVWIIFHCLFRSTPRVIFIEIDPDRHTALFSMVAMSLATGEIVYDSFSDDADRGELATRICHIRPVEVLVSQQVSNRTQRFLTSFSSSRAAAPRIEVISAEFYAGYNDFDVIFGS